MRQDKDLNCICGVVVQGRQVGRTLGFPTANVESSDGKDCKDGVYIVEVELCGQYYRGIMSIGTRPTFGLQERQIEVHILNFDEDIYGCFIKIHPIRFLRDNQKFDNPTQLIQQMKKDKQIVLDFFAENGMVNKKRLDVHHI